MPAKRKRNQKRKLAESLGRAEILPENFSDEEKWMYLVFRNELRTLIDWESEYDYYWKDHVLQMMTGCHPGTLSMELDHEENLKDSVIESLVKRQKFNEAFHVATGSNLFCFHAKSHDAIIQHKTDPCCRVLSIEDAQAGLTCGLWTRRERLDAVKTVHSALNAVSMGNCHSAVSGIGGTARAATKVAILLALQTAHGVGGTLLDVGCSFGHFMLAALLMGYAGVCGCDLPENQVQSAVLTRAKAQLGISPDGLCEWIGSDVGKLILPDHLSRRITAVYSFWNGLGAAAQRRTLNLCRKLVNVRSVAVYRAKGWSTPEAGITKLYS